MLYGAWLDWSRAMAENKMLSFVDTGQSYPEKRSAEERGDDFLEISRAYLFEKAEEQASRCTQCGVPYCSVHCPLNNHLPAWLHIPAAGRLREAYELRAEQSSVGNEGVQ